MKQEIANMQCLLDTPCWDQNVTDRQHENSITPHKHSLRGYYKGGGGGGY